MRRPLFSSAVMLVSVLSVLFVTGCDRREQKVEDIPAVQGSLLANGKVPAVSPEGAAALKEMILNISFVKMYEGLFRDATKKMSGEDLEKMRDNIEVIGEFDVIPGRDYYDVTFPHAIKLNIPEDEQKNGVTSATLFLNYALKVRPTGDPAAFRVEFVENLKPVSVSLHTAEGDYEVFVVTHEKGGEPFKAMWHNDLQSFVQMTGALPNVTATLDIPDFLRKPGDDVDHLSVKIGYVSSDARMTPDANNLWSGPYNAAMDNIVIELPEKVGDISILKLAVVQTLEKINPTAYKNFYQFYDDMMSKMSEGTHPEDLSTEYVTQMLTAYKNLLVDGFEKMDMSLKLSDISTRLNKTPSNPAEVKKFSLDEAEAIYNVSGLQQNSGTIGFGYALKGLDVGLGQFKDELGGEAPQELIPQNIKFGLQVEKLPAVSLVDYALKSLKDAPGDGENAEKALLQSPDEFLALLSEAGTSVKTDGSYIGNDIWLLLMNGATKVNKDAVYKAEGQTEIRFYGLDYLMQALDQRLKNPETSPIAAQAVQQAAGGLGMLQMFGQQKKDDQNRDYRSYVITIAPEGTVQMNGTDLTQMMGMMH
ncbi:MAG: hypothetical protein H6857_02325 [Rhodospirillales bacterium]|nr:hypothetical protein [Rhodospirillales bacterium]